MATVTKTYSLKVETQDKEVDELNKKLKQTDADIGSIEKAGDSMTGGLVSGFKGGVKGVKSMILGLKTMRGAVIATGVGALVIAVTSLTAAFTSSEEGQNKLAKVMAVLGSITGNIIDLFAVLGNGIISVFTNPVETIKGFADTIKTFVLDRITGLLDSIGLLGSAIKKVFSGDFSGALEDTKKSFKGLVDNSPFGLIRDGIKSAAEATKNLVKEMLVEAKIAASIADNRAKADKLDRALLVERASADRDRAQLLEQALDKEKFSVKERIEFLKEAGALEEEITNKEIQAAKLRFDAKVAENALAGSTKEDLDEEFRLKAALIQLETAKLNKAKEVTSQIIGLNAEVAAAKKVIDDEAKATQDAADIAEDERQKAIKEKNKTLEQLKLDEEAVSFQQKTELAQTRALAELDALNATEEQKAATILFWQGKVLDAKIKDAKEEGVVDEVLQKQKIAIIGQTFGAISKILGENSKAGKAFGIAQALTNTYLGVTEVLSNETTIPEPFGSIQKAVSIAGVLSTGFAAVKQIKSVTPSSAASTISPPTTGATASPPAFNIVGADSNNQLASAIGGQTQQPVQAFVVSQDVTTAQSLERNIITSATIG